MFGQEEQKADTQLDLMDFISKSDFSTVGGQGKQQNANEEFSQFGGNTNQAAGGQGADSFFGAGGNTN
jgi:hypothetical protein